MSMRMNSASGYPLKGDTDAWKVAAIQKWNKKWSTFQRYAVYDMDNFGKAKQWNVGVAMQYSPALLFVLDYADFDGTLQSGKVDPEKSNSVVRFRTVLNF